MDKVEKVFNQLKELFTNSERYGEVVVQYDDKRYVFDGNGGMTVEDWCDDEFKGAKLMVISEDYLSDYYDETGRIPSDIEKIAEAEYGYFEAWHNWAFALAI